MIEKRLAEIAARKLEIRGLLDSNAEVNLDEIKTEMDKLEAEERTLQAKRAMAAQIQAGTVGARTIEQPQAGTEQRDFAAMGAGVIAAPEYRSAFLKRLQGKELLDVEKRALTTGEASVGSAVPEQTANEILRKVKQFAPLLGEITLLHVTGNVKFAVEGTVADAALHTEGATITASADTLVTVSLGGYEINKLITISKSVATMSINAFETWLTDMLAEAIANRISAYLITGTGSSQPQGINTAQTWGAGNSVTVTLAGTLSAANVQTLVGLLPGGYDAGAKFVMSKKTFFTDFVPLQDNSKHDLVTKEGASYYVYGYPVLFDDRVTYHEAFLGNLRKAIVGNLAEQINVASAFDIKTNSFDYLGAAIFDSKVAIGEAVVKLVKATS